MTPRAIVLTGATGGLGQALVRRLAQPGRTLLLFGRDTERLARVEETARSVGAAVSVSTADMRDADAFRDAVDGFARDQGVDLLICNAGVKTSNAAGVEPPGQAERVLSVNLGAPILQVQATLPHLRPDARIALVSSLAARAPHPDLLSYSASKAGILAYGAALRRCLRDQGIGVSVIVPGFVDTPMTDRHKGRTPFLLPPDRAAGLIVRGLERRRPVITFPWQLALLVRLSNVLPTALSDRIEARFRADILPDSDAAP